MTAHDTDDSTSRRNAATDGSLGLDFQCAVAAYYIAEMLAARADPPHIQIQSVALEQIEIEGEPNWVDDVVVAYADGSRRCIQAKLHKKTIDHGWASIWQQFHKQVGVALKQTPLRDVRLPLRLELASTEDALPLIRTLRSLARLARDHGEPANLKVHAGGASKMLDRIVEVFTKQKMDEAAALAAAHACLRALDAESKPYPWGASELYAGRVRERLRHAVGDEKAHNAFERMQAWCRTVSTGTTDPPYPLDRRFTIEWVAEHLEQAGMPLRPALRRPEDAAGGLPEDLEQFSGRRELLHALGERLAASGRVVLTSLAGMGGVGKSVLAIRYAHQRLDEGETVVYARLDAGSPEGHMLAIGRALGVALPAEAEPDALAGALQGVYASTGGLLLLDNADRHSALERLLPQRGDWRVVVTTRERDVAVALAPHGVLDVLPFVEKEAAELFDYWLGPERAAAEREDIDALREAMGGLALALDIAAAYIKSAPGTSVREFLERWRKEERRLRLLEQDFPHRSVRASLALSLEGLEWRARRTLYALGAFDAAAGAATVNVAAVVAAEEAIAQGDLRDLQRKSVVEAVAERRFRLHPLMYEVVRRIAAEDKVLTALEDEHARHFAIFAEVLSDLVDAERSTDALFLFYRDAPNWRHAVERLRERSIDDDAGLDDDLGCPCSLRGRCAMRLDQFAALLWEPAARRGMLDDGLAAARERGDRWAEANCLRSLGDLKARLADLDGARADYEAALPLFRAVQDRLGEANCLRSMANLAVAEGRLGDARSLYETALETHRQIQDRLGEASTLGQIGLLLQQEERDREGIGAFEKCLAISREIREPTYVPMALRYLCLSAARLGDCEVLGTALGELLPLALAAGPQEHLGSLDWLLRRCWPAARLQSEEIGAEAFGAIREGYEKLLEDQADESREQALAGLAALAVNAVMAKMAGNDQVASRFAEMFDRVVQGFDLASFIGSIEPPGEGTPES